MNYSIVSIPGSNSVGSYELSVQKTFQSGTKALEVTKLNIVHIEIIPLGVNATGVSGPTNPKHVFEATRDLPFTPWKLVNAALYLKPPTSEANAEAVSRYLASLRGRVAGILAGSANGASEDIGAILVYANPENGPADRIMVDLMDGNSFRSGKLIGKAYVEKNALDVIVQTRDGLVWPFVVAGLGVWLAFFVSNFSSRGRILAVIRTEISNLQQRVILAAHQTQKIAGFSKYDIWPAWQAFEANADATLTLLRLRAAPLDLTNSEFSNLKKDLGNRQQLPDDLLEFGRILDELHALDFSPSTFTPFDTLPPQPQMLLRVNRLLSGAPFRRLDDFDAKLTETKAAATDAELWLRTFEFLKMLHHASADNKQQNDVNNQLGRLWMGDDPNVIRDVAIKARQIADDLGGSVGLLAREGAFVAPASPLNNRDPLVIVQRGDLVSAAVSVSIGILVALNTVYFPGPFGSVGDYFKIFAVALTTKVGVDFTAAAFNRITDASRTIGGQTITRA